MPAALVVGMGASVGAVARWLLATVLVEASLSVWVTVAINVVGCVVMGWCAPGLFWGTGFLGGFTTFSAYAVASLEQPVVGVVTVVACLAGWGVGWLLRERGAPR